MQHVSLGRTVPPPVRKTVRRDARAQRDVWEDVFRVGGGSGVTNVRPSLTPITLQKFKNLKLLIAKKKQKKTTTKIHSSKTLNILTYMYCVYTSDMIFKIIIKKTMVFKRFKN